MARNAAAKSRMILAYMNYGILLLLVMSAAFVFVSVVRLFALLDSQLHLPRSQRGKHWCAAQVATLTPTYSSVRTAVMVGSAPVVDGVHWLAHSWADLPLVGMLQGRPALVWWNRPLAVLIAIL